MKVVAAFPCLGKTTFANLNKDRVLDKEIKESASIKGMSEKEMFEFFKAEAMAINMIYKTGYYDMLLISEDARLMSQLFGLNPEIEKDITYVFPDLWHDSEHMYNYLNRVLARDGSDYYKKIIAPKIKDLKERLTTLINIGYDVRLTTIKQPFFWQTLDLDNGYNLPNYVVPNYNVEE